MIMHEIIDRFHSLDGLLHIAPEPDSPYPELVWGDHFFYFAPDGEVPANTQPFATITTKDYPDDTASRLSAPDRWRLNLHIGRARFSELVDEPGPTPRRTPWIASPSQTQSTPTRSTAGRGGLPW